jgi:hypothetical protein
VVRDKETGKPMAGVLVGVDVPLEVGMGATLPPPGTNLPRVTARTDKEGRYEIAGFPKSPSYTVYARPDTGRHFAVGVRFKDTPGLGPLKADLQVPGGALVLRGKVTDQRSGKPVPGARVYYLPLFRNPATDKLADYSYFESAATAGPDGSFSLAGLPGLGALAVVAPAADAYRVAEVTPREIIAFYDKHKEPLPQGGASVYLLRDSKGGMGLIPRRVFHVLSLIHPEKKAKEVKQDLVLRPF